MAATLMLLPQLVAMPATSMRLIVAAIVAFAVIIVLITWLRLGVLLLNLII